MRLCAVLLVVGLAGGLLEPRAARAQTEAARNATSLRSVISDAEVRTGYRFLYRDALIAGITLRLDAPDSLLLPALAEALATEGVHLRIDHERRQVLLTEPAVAEQAGLAGVVVDDATGARLPYATVTWHEGGRLRGVVATEAGTFRVDPPTRSTPLVVTASYVGYEPQHVPLNAASGGGAVTIRLRPQETAGPEVVVHSNALSSELDTSWHHLIAPSHAAPLGEHSLLGALQVLPSVALSPALASGLNVRGSREDAFQVLLDGVPIYNQQHLFGLFDAFNAEALQAVGLYYGVAPASLPAPPGGTLSYITRTGAQTVPSLSIGVSSTTVRATAEGPLANGRGSWLISGRRSYLSAVDWFNNAEIVARGLDATPGFTPPGFQLRPLLQDRPTARFYDLHAKLYLEPTAGRRQMLSVYLGGDDARYEADRLQIDSSAAGGRTLTTADTQDRWGNLAVSLQDQRGLRSDAYLFSTVGLSRYHSRYRKDDFVYTSRAGVPGSPDQGNRFTAPYAQTNTLTQLTLTQHLALSPGVNQTATLGYALHVFEVLYEEESALRQDAVFEAPFVNADVFGEWEGGLLPSMRAQVGLRGHLVTRGRLARLSPRLRLHLWPDRTVAATLGYSRTHQFLHRLTLEPLASSAVWIPTPEQEQPGYADQVTAGLNVRVADVAVLGVEAYAKRSHHVRRHVSGVRRAPTGATSILLTPWLSQNTVWSRGAEVLLRHPLGPTRWTHGYTLSRTDIRHPDLADGDYVPAEWDRRHQYTAHVEGSPRQGWSWHLTWFVASGTPNDLAVAEPSEPRRLPSYQRLDASLAFEAAVGVTDLTLRASVYNLLDRDNTLYRTLTPVIDPTGRPRRLTFTPTSVYDLGLQPSFEVVVTF